MRERGKSEEEIERYVPKTFNEQSVIQQKRLSEHEQLKADVALLKTEVAALKESMSLLAPQTQISKKNAEDPHPDASSSTNNEGLKDQN